MFKENIKKNFNKSSETYEQVAFVQRETSLQLVDYIQKKASSTKFEKILDIGTGTGFVTEALLHYFPHADYLLNDVSSLMLNRALQKFKAYKNIDFHLGDAELLPFDKRDLIASNFAFQWFEELETTLKILWDKTKVLAFSTLVEGTFSDWKEIHQSLGIVSGLHEYPSILNLEKYCLSLSPKNYFFETKTYNISFESSASFVRYLKELGANTPNVEYAKSTLRQVLKTVKSGFTTNYHVFFAILIK